MMNFRILLLFMAFNVSLMLLFSCKDSDSSGSSSTSNTKLILKFQPRVNNQNLAIGTQMRLANGDVIIVNELKFYFTTPKLTLGGQAVSTTDIFLYQPQTTEWTIEGKFSNGSLTNIEMLQGLTDAQNNTIPTSVSSSHPLSSYAGMYWTEWTKYRYVIFEGKIKKSEQSDFKDFVYHTGLTYLNYCSLPLNQTLNLGQTNNATIYLNIDQIFNPTSGAAIDYAAGELITHSEPSDAALSTKFAKNFVAAFSLN